MTPVKKSIAKLRKLKEIRRKNLEKNFLEIQMKGQDHYIFMNERGKAQVVSKGKWVTEHIRTAVLKFNYEIDKIDKLLIRDFTEKEINQYEKTFSKDVDLGFSFLISTTTRLASSSISLFSKEAIKISWSNFFLTR